MKTLGWPLIIFRLPLFLFLHTAAFHCILSRVIFFLLYFMLCVASHFSSLYSLYWKLSSTIYFQKTPCSFLSIAVPSYISHNYLICIPFLPFLVINNFLTQLLMVNCSCNNRENEKYSLWFQFTQTLLYIGTYCRYFPPPPHLSTYDFSRDGILLLGSQYF